MYKLCGGVFAIRGNPQRPPPGPEPPGVPRLASGRPNVILNVNFQCTFLFSVSLCLCPNVLIISCSDGVLFTLRFLNCASRYRDTHT